MPGWLKLHRKLNRSDMWTSEKFTRGQAWVDLLMRASFHDGFIRVRGIRIDYSRGQYCASMKGLADRWKWSQGKVKRFLNELKNEEQIEHQNSGVTTLITITNYAQYQDDGEQNGEQTVSKQGADGEQTESRRRHSNKVKEGEEGKKVEEDPQPLSGTPSVEIEKESIPYHDIIDHLNEKVGKNFSSKASGNRDIIKARWNEGFDLDTFRNVIDNMVSRWKCDPKMEQYLRPATLFKKGGMDGYANAGPGTPGSAGASGGKAERAKEPPTGSTVDWTGDFPERDIDMWK